MKIKLHFLFALLFSLTLFKAKAQTPQYSVTVTAGGNYFPFGATAADNNKVQWLFYANDMTGAYYGLITDVYFKINSPYSGVASNTTYNNLTIKMGTLPTTFTGFTTGAFLGGLTTCAIHPTYTITNTANGAWFKIPLQNPFLYDPSLNLVVEVSQTGYTGSGFFAEHGAGAGGNRRLYANISSATGTANTGWPHMGIDMIPAEYYPTITGGGKFCSGEDIKLKVSPPPQSDTLEGYTFYWTLPDGSHSTDSILNYPNAQAGPTGPSGTYKVIMIADTGSLPLDTSGEVLVQVYVQQVPPPPTVAPLITYCQNSPADTIPIHGQNIKWYSVDTGGTAVTTQPVINTGTAGSFTYYVSQTFGGCESARVPVTVQVVPQAPPPTVTSPVSYCQNDVAVALQAIGQNLLWYSTDTGGVGTPIVPVPSTLAQGTFYWYVTQTIDGCESVRVPIEIRINYRPNALILGSRPFVCEGDTLSFSYYGNADGDVNVNFNWDWPSGATIVSGSGQGPYVIRFDSAGARTVRLVVDNDGCMSPEALFHIEVRPLPVFSLEVPEQACQGEIVNLVINQATPGIDSFVWSIDGGEKVYASETAGPYGVRWNEAGQKTITVVGTDRTCKAAPVSDVINIRWLPDATISTPNGTGVCAGDSILVEGVYNPEYTYQWLPEQYFIENNGYRQWARIDYAREITLNVTDVYNCKSSSSIWVTPQNCCVVSFPTAFTPNSDGRNDVFRPITQGHQKITSFVVKNRWGQQVFESADDRLGWDGRFGGAPQDMGTYFYYIKYQCSDGKFYEEKGEVMLVR